MLKYLTHTAESSRKVLGKFFGKFSESSSESSRKVLQMTNEYKISLKHLKIKQEMRQFINLTTTVINKLHIAEITKSPQKYRIYMSNNNLNGGYISSLYNVIEICEIKNSLDYKKITEFIFANSE